MPSDPPIAELPLWIMGGGWVRVTCGCGRSVDLPTRMAAQVSYADRADDWRARGGLRGARRIWLVR